MIISCAYCKHFHLAYFLSHIHQCNVCALKLTAQICSSILKSALRRLWSMLALMCYSFNTAMSWISVSGPYYKYRTYYDMLHLRADANIPITQYSIERLKQIPVIVTVYLVVSSYFSLEVQGFKQTFTLVFMLVFTSY